MNILPRLLFLFQSLPIKIPMSTFTTLNKWLSKFIWQNKRPRIRLKTLMCPKEIGGLNIPNLKNYYYAAQLRSLLTWVCQEEDSIWFGMEQGDCPGMFLDTIPFINPDAWSKEKKKVTNEWVKTTLSIWSNIRKTLNLSSSLCRLIHIHHNLEFPPSSGFKNWAGKGLIMLDQMVERGSLMSFQQLQQRYDLPAQDFYKYLQVRNYFVKHNYITLLQTPPTNLEQFVIHVIKGEINSRYISHAYKLLQENTENTQDIKRKWELEMNIIIKDDDWERTLREGHKITNSPSLKEFEWKTKIRFFRSPFVTSKFGGTSDRCWRGCVLVGDYTHVFWDCPKLTNYWKDIQGEIENWKQDARVYVYKLSLFFFLPPTVMLALL
uniref:Reverse transcriptase n=1 Tax=Gouania willdenowi TaxID=441366 RepID=A0A8C5H005_GOUWI